MVPSSAHAKHALPFNCNNTIQDKTKARKVPIDEGKGAYWRKHVLMMGQARKVRINAE